MLCLAPREPGVLGLLQACRLRTAAAGAPPPGVLARATPPQRPCPPPSQLVHLLAHWGAKRSQRKAGAGGRSPASASTANLLSHEDQRNARLAAAPTAAPAAPSIPRLKRPGSAGAAADGGAAAAGAERGDVETSGSAATTPRAAADAAAPPPSDDCDGGASGGSSVSTQLNELSAPPGLLTEPCDAMTSAVVAASCPDTVAAGEGGEKGGGEVRAGHGAAAGPLGRAARWSRLLRPLQRPLLHRPAASPRHPAPTAGRGGRRRHQQPHAAGGG